MIIVSAYYFLNMNGKLMEIYKKTGILASLLVIILFSTSCASVNGRQAPEHDPWEAYNRDMFAFNEDFYEYILDPVTRGYQKVTPDFVQTGVSNLFNHVDDIFVMVNDILQFKIRQFVEDFMRFVFNTFFGLFGLIDVASHMDLPKHKEDFGQTLATWGVGPGPYFVLPFLGPSTLRDTTGTAVEWEYGLTRRIEDDESKYGVIVLQAVDKRAGLLKASRIVEQASFDKYAFTRDAYLQLRNSQVHDGNPPREKPVVAPTTKEEEALEDELELELLKSP